MSDIDSSNIDSSNKQTFQETLENSLCLALNKILQNQPSADIPLPEEFYQDSKMVLKNRISVTLGDLLDFKEGSILETEIAVSTPLNCYANKKFLGMFVYCLSLYCLSLYCTRSNFYFSLRLCFLREYYLFIWDLLFLFC